MGREDGTGIMISCDYNGWTDAPEAEREWFDQHPEIWEGASPERRQRPRAVTPRVRETYRGGLAA